MKKSLIALAVLAASGAAMAQSTVTLYGIADIYFANEKATTGVTDNKLSSGGVNGSRWGIKGSEDLGGGLKANFDLQQGFNMDTGAAAQRKDIAGNNVDAGFNRQAWVGFSGDFGAVRFGNTTTPFDDYSGALNALWDSKVAPANYVFKSIGYNARTGNALFYSTPDLSGFTAEVLYSLGEDKTNTTSASSATSVSLAYAAGPLAVQFAYQVEDIANTLAKPNDAKFTRLGASYDFGAAVLKVTYGKAQNIANAADSDATDYQIGVDVPVSAALTLSGSYAKSNDSKAAGVYEQSRKGYGLGAKYVLSKRTFLYGGYESDTATVQNADDLKHTIFAVGVQHRF